MCAVGFTLATIAPLSPAIADSPIPGASVQSIDALVGSLGSTDFAARDEAFKQLARRDDFNLAQVERAIKSGNASPEQRERLMTLGRLAFDRSPRGALGVQFMNAGQSLMIQRIIPGFPSAATLKPGDEILTVNGEPVRQVSRFDFGDAQPLRPLRPHIISRDPGHKVTLTIMRPAEGKVFAPQLDDRFGLPLHADDRQKLTIEVELGAFDNLSRNQFNSFDTITPDQALEAWRIRARDIAGAGPEPIGSDLPGDDLGDIYDRPGFARRGGSQGARTSGIITAGGEPMDGRPGVGGRAFAGEADDSILIPNRDGMRRLGQNGNGIRVQVIAPNQREATAVARQQLAEQRGALSRRQAELFAEATRLKAQVDQLDPNDRSLNARTLRQQLDEKNAIIKSLNEQITVIEEKSRLIRPMGR